MMRRAEGDGASVVHFARASALAANEPHSARVYDYLLGGKDNFSADRAFAERLLKREPDACTLARAHRDFLVRAVGRLTAAGIRQFLDIGTGLPAQGHVYEHFPPDARVAYVDRDLIVLSHARAVIGSRPGAAIIEGDLRSPEQILDHPGTQRVIDVDEPFAVLLCGIVHFLREQEVDRIIAALRESMPPGSYLVLTHATGEVPDAKAAARAHEVQGLYTQTDRSGPLRTLARIREFFDGLDLVEPGLAPVSKWNPDPDPDSPALKQDINHDHVWLYGGVGRKPAAPVC